MALPMDELIEKVARVLGAAYDGYADPVETPNNWANAEQAARDVIPIVLEEAAKVAVLEAHRNKANAAQYSPQEDGGDGSKEDCFTAAIACFDVAQAIRSLKGMIDVTE